MRASLCSLALLSLASCEASVPASTQTGDEEAPIADGDVELRASCAPLLSQLELARDIGSAGSEDITIDSHARGEEECADFAWVRGFVSSAALITPGWAGPSLATSAWDCNHSTLEYGVYRRSGERWQYVDGAMAFGNLGDSGECAYSVNNFPRQDGSDQTAVLGATEQAAIEVRVGVRAWSHNDPAMGHSGHDCASKSCYWPVRLRWQLY